MTPTTKPSTNRLITLGLILLLSVTAGPSLFAATGTLLPAAYQTLLDANGNPVSNGKVCTYTAGTSTPATTYTDSALLVPNANPIRTDSSGRWVAYVVPGQAYKIVFQDSSGTVATCDGAIIRTQDNVAGVPASAATVDVTGTAGEALTAGQAVYLSDGSGAKTPGLWYKADATNTYSSTNPEVGIAPAAISAASQGTIRIAGQVTGLSSLTVGATYYISGTAGALTSTAPVNQRILGVADSTSSLVLVPSPAKVLTQGTSTITTTGTQTALTLPSGIGDLVIFANNASLLTVQGITAGVDGQRLTIFSLGAGIVSFVHQSGSASAANRLINFVASGSTSLAAGVGSAIFQYDLTTARWRLVTHDQGDWITPTFAAGDYTASGAQTWTLASGDVVVNRYYLRGRILEVRVQLATTTVGGTPSTELRQALPGGYTSAAFESDFVCNAFDNGSTGVFSLAAVTSSVTFIRYYKTPSGTGNWAAATDATSVYFAGAVPVS